MAWRDGLAGWPRRTDVAGWPCGMALQVGETDGELGTPAGSSGHRPRRAPEMPGESSLEEVVARVEEPELRRGLGELGLVREVRSRWGRASARVGLVAAAHPQREELERRVEAALASGGARSVEVDLEPLGDAERAQLARRLRGSAGTAGEPPRDAPAPLGHEEGKANPFQRPGSPTRVIGISSGKGGVGKSSVTVNLAMALARLGSRVAVLDADVYGFSVPGMLGVSRAPLVVGDLLIPPVAHGVACISMGFFVEDDTPVIWRGPMLHKAL
ncbi:MAG: P-loop NTPase, partial [Acidimicrobiales bacterium]